MNTLDVTEDNLDRLAKAIMLKHSVGYAEALELLSRFKLRLVCDGRVAQSSALQAALLTAINAGKRAFHGGVFVAMPEDVPCLLNWPGDMSLNQIVQTLGGNFAASDDSPYAQTLYFGPAENPVEDGLSVFCSGWRGGVAPVNSPFDFSSSSDFALGGIAAGALGVARGFFRVSGLSSRSLDVPQGISLWRPDLPWSSVEAEGPTLELLPKNLWMLGLGHLGQAYLWSFALLPYVTPDEVHFVLQDYDRAVKGNYSSGLLCEEHNIGKHKTRICSDWLEDRGFQTTITERAFDGQTKRTGKEPFVACCGFDSAEPRRGLEQSGFDLIVECALGSDAARFDRIILHTFPEASRGPERIWAESPQVAVDPKLLNAFNRKDVCGVIAETLARKAVSSSFVGAVAGSLVAGEILRALHGGTRCELIQTHLRHNEQPGVIVKPENYSLKVARSGFCPVRLPQRIAA